MSPSAENKYKSLKSYGTEQEAEYFENKIGFGFRQQNFLSFFGNIHADISTLQQEFPNLVFCRLKQTHSDLVIESNSTYEDDPHLFGQDSCFEGDSHFTSQTRRALTIATADCMPIMIWCHETKRVAAVHAGWRGVENKIVVKTIDRLVETGSRKKQFQFFVGPSIQQISFEIDRDVFDRLNAASYDLSANEFSFDKSLKTDLNNSSVMKTKYYVDLNAVLLSQIHFVVGKNASVIFSKIDTKTNSDFYSYRRGKQTKERNLSFTCLLT